MSSRILTITPFSKKSVEPWLDNFLRLCDQCDGFLFTGVQGKRVRQVLIDFYCQDKELEEIAKSCHLTQEEAAGLLKVYITRIMQCFSPKVLLEEMVLPYGVRLFFVQRGYQTVAQIILGVIKNDFVTKQQRFWVKMVLVQAHHFLGINTKTLVERYLDQK